MKNKIKRALVTGGSGFIGSYLCEQLLTRGFKVFAVDNLSTSSKSNIAHLLKDASFRFYEGSIMDKALMRRLVGKCDIIYHLAAAVGVKYILGNSVGSILTNIEGTENILRLADTLHKKVVIASTSEVYGKHACSPFRENDDRTLGPTQVSRWSYAEAKAMDEFLALAYAKERKLRVVIVRLFNTIGPRQVSRYGMVLPKFIEEALGNKPLTVFGDGSQLRSFTHVKDAVSAIVALSLEKKAEGEIFNVGTDQTISIKELAVKIKTMTRSKSRIRCVSYDKAFGKRSADFEDILCRIPDISKIKKVINYRPKYDIDAMIKETVDYFLKK